MDGKWDKSKLIFEECKKSHPGNISNIYLIYFIFVLIFYYCYLDDGPMASLMNVMAEYKFKAPSDWPGYRVLTEKWREIGE